MTASLIEASPWAVWLWMMNTSVPRTDSSNRQWISPLAKSAMLGSTQRLAEGVGDLGGQIVIGPT